MKSFQVYLPGGRVLTRAGYLVIVGAALAMFIVATKITSLPGFSEFSSGTVLALTVGVGSLSVSLGRLLVVRALKLPFSKKMDD